MRSVARHAAILVGTLGVLAAAPAWGQSQLPASPATGLETVASNQDSGAQNFDAVPDPIETSPLPEVTPGAPDAVDEPALVEPAPVEPEPALQTVVPVTPKVIVAPTNALATALLAGLKPTAQPKRKIQKQNAETTLKQQMWRFYAERGGQPLWLKNGAFSEPALQIIGEVAKAKDWGLDPARFDVPVSVPANATEQQQIDVELKFTRAVLDYATQARIGQFEPEKISDLIDRASAAPSAYTVLSTVAAAPDVAQGLVSFHPQHPQYERLRKAYLALRDGTQGPAPVTIPDGPKLKPGTSHPHVALMRKRLSVPVPTADADDEGDPAERYDPALVDAVKVYQRDNGLKVDGIISKPVRLSLNGDKTESKDKRIERLLANMERWRWVPDDLGTLYIQNNIPEYMTRLVKDGEVIFTERIVVGRPNTPTSIFTDRMEYVEFNPYWNVPTSIKVNELLPSIQRNGGGALRRQGLRVRYAGQEMDPEELNWGTVDIRNVDVFQPPGSGNALGRVKFMFPNRHDIYMHDTPSKSLFNESSRAFSHGCLRVRNPDAFAEALLAESNGMGQSDVKLQFATDQNHQLKLDRKVPVYVTYFTAWVADDGSISTKNDIYGHDPRTTLALAGRYDDIDRQVAPKPDIQSALGKVDGRRLRVANQQQGGASIFEIFDAWPQPQSQVKNDTSGGAWKNPLMER